ncbi:MAG: ATP-binding cassette domain-containing protein [Microthrixaceae bacterium]
MQCAAGLDKLSSGGAIIGEVNISRLNEKALTLLRRERVGFIFRQFNLLPVLNAQENILFPLTLAGRQPDQAWMDQVIDTVGLRDRLSHKPSELSGGQQQRVAVARALVERPQIIFADEPTGNLDSHSSAEILAFMRSAVTNFGQTVVMVTHDPAAAACVQSPVPGGRSDRRRTDGSNSRFGPRTHANAGQLKSCSATHSNLSGRISPGSSPLPSQSFWASASSLRA